ncbi:hypothetical protein AGDE_05580 [Angomonas deanei]|nr:hypothetical protein AGDE_10675 [Angomonas deanei]EPY38349.1 hypothetical protein AGDE_05580 [Angomonas deanei]|eukprot:EPY27620.1 hypothetical protein AGDE_10675 [Angomonas deanei]
MLRRTVTPLVFSCGAFRHSLAFRQKRPAAEGRTSTANKSSFAGSLGANFKQELAKGAMGAKLGKLTPTASSKPVLVEPPAYEETALTVGRRNTAKEVARQEEEGDTASSEPLLSNPFRNIHDYVVRSYRLDQVLAKSTGQDLVFARQEKKSTAFSFITLCKNSLFYKGHWMCAPDLRDLYNTSRLKSNHQRLLSKTSDDDGSTTRRFYNPTVGLGAPQLHADYALIVAQRLLLFPDSNRHFHAVVGREGVPCDFFADIDLPNETHESGEKILLEIISYLEVRLPGIGFTHPFFLVLANENSMKGGRKGKVSYHLHVRSMTHLLARFEAKGVEEVYQKLHRKNIQMVTGAYRSVTLEKEKKRGKKGGDDGVVDTEDDMEDDLSDLVKAVEEGPPKEKPGALVESKLASKVIAFQDFRIVKLIAEEINQTLGKNVIDLNCYRTNGMLRCAFNYKIASTNNNEVDLAKYTHKGKSAEDKEDNNNSSNSSGGRLVPFTQSQSGNGELQAKLDATNKVLRHLSDPEVLELSFCTRHMEGDASNLKNINSYVKRNFSITAPANSSVKVKHEYQLYRTYLTNKHHFKSIKPRHVLGPLYNVQQEFDMYGNLVSPFLTEKAKWKRFKTAVEKLHHLPPHAAEGFDTWVRVGLALHNFSNEDHVFEEWVKFSLRCPTKFSRETCRKKWTQFERNPDALNWRRGFNYLYHTIWRGL